MEKDFNIKGKKVHVKFFRHVVRLKAGYACRALMKERGGLNGIAIAIRNEYATLYSRPLRVTKNSLIIEIAGHVYAYRLSLFLRKLTSVGYLRKFSYHVCKIDCGEKGHDGNRWAWDILGFLAPLLFSGKRGAADN